MWQPRASVPWWWIVLIVLGLTIWLGFLAGAQAAEAAGAGTAASSTYLWALKTDYLDTGLLGKTSTSTANLFASTTISFNGLGVDFSGNNYLYSTSTYDILQLGSQNYSWSFSFWLKATSDLVNTRTIFSSDIVNSSTKRVWIYIPPDNGTSSQVCVTDEIHSDKCKVSIPFDGNYHLFSASYDIHQPTGVWAFYKDGAYVTSTTTYWNWSSGHPLDLGYTNYISAPSFANGLSIARFSWAGKDYKYTASDTLDIYNLGLGTPVPAVNFNFPLNGATTTDSFTQWIFDFHTLPGSNFTLTTHLGFSTSSFPVTEIQNLDFPNGGTTLGYGVLRQSSLWYPPLSSPVQWYAYATLYDNIAAQNIATSSVIGFQAYSSLYGGGGGVSPPAGTSTTPVISCDPNTSFLQNSFCNLFIYLLVPPTSTLNAWGGLKTAFMAKPPLGYFYAAYNAISGITEGTTSIVLMSASTTAAFSGILTPVKSAFIWLLWLLFLAWLYHRLKHLQL